MNSVFSGHRHPPEHFINRELSLLAFNRRVLAQAADARVPLLERLRFLCIVSSNLDEFFEIRVAGLKEQIKLGGHATGADGLSPQEVFRRVTQEAHTLIAEQYALLNDAILPALAAEGIHFYKRRTWTPEQGEWIRDFFFREVMPVLTPIGLDPAHPFPARAQQEPEFRRRTGRQGRLRPQLAAPPSCRRRAPCRASSSCRGNSPASTTASSSCRRSCTATSANCLPA